MSTIIEPQDRTVDVDGLNMHYLEWGNPAKPTIVLLHGLRGHGHSWDDVSEALSPDLHVLALDQRGRGLTDWAPDGDYSTEAFVGDLVGFCRALGLEKFILMGHSMGARNSMAFCDTHAHMLEKLVLSEFGPQINPKGGQRISKELVDVPEEFDTLDDASFTPPRNCPTARSVGATTSRSARRAAAATRSCQWICGRRWRRSNARPW